jgi:hypothetical protein
LRIILSLQYDVTAILAKGEMRDAPQEILAFWHQFIRPEPRHTRQYW